MTDAEMLRTQAAIASALYFVMEGLKKSNSQWLRWIGDSTPWLNRGVSLFVAAMVSLGFTWEVTGSLTTGGFVKIWYPSLSTLTDVCVTFITQMGMQHGSYKLFTYGRDRAGG